MISYSSKGNFKKTNTYLHKLFKLNLESILEKYGKIGVDELSRATPLDSGVTASSWYYKATIKERDKYAILSFFNKNVVNDVPIALIIQYGHATRSGSWVEGIDYINPAMEPVFDELLDKICKDIKKL